MIKDNERRIVRMSQIYFKENHNLAVPKKYKCEFEGKTYSFGSMLGHIKGFFNSKDDQSKKQPMVYSEKLLKYLQALDPRVFEKNYGRNLYREEKEKKLLKLFRQYFAENGNLGIKQTYFVKEKSTGEIVFLGAELVLMRQYVNGNKRNIYDKAFIEDIKALDPHVFDFCYPRMCRRTKTKEENKEKEFQK